MAPELKEFLYVDVDRVRSLLAQMAGGVVDEIRSSITNNLQGGARAALFGIGASGEYTRGTQHEESRSLQELIFVTFERMANDENLIADLDSEVFDHDSWSRGEVHRQIQRGQLARLDCDIQMLDGSFFASRVRRLISLSEAIVDMNPLPDLPRNANARVRQQVRDDLVAKALGGMSKGQLEAIISAIDAFVGDSVAVRLLPCGEEYLEYGFTGALLGRREYLQAERENLFSRYGQAPAPWTVVFQVAAIPSDVDTESPEPPSDTLDSAGRVNRAIMERFASSLMGYMESMGIVEGPLWPSISITPLGIYRTVPVRS